MLTPRRFPTRWLLLAALLAWVAAALPQSAWQTDFSVDRKRLGPSARNPYFPLTPGHRLYYEHGRETLTTTVLNEKKLIDGVETRVGEDRETKNGQVVEVTLDYYAADSATNDVYYFGEDVDAYRNGKVANHSGAWLSGVKGARFGLFIPGSPKSGQKFYQEQAPGVAMDRAEIVALDETVTTPAGKFAHCVKVRETNPLEKGPPGYKWYAPGVGMVKDGDLVLVRIGPNGK